VTRYIPIDQSHGEKVTNLKTSQRGGGAAEQSITRDSHP